MCLKKRVSFAAAAFGFKSLSGSNDIDLSDAATQPITDIETLNSNSDKMRYKMEAFITNLQGKIVKELQSLENDAKFVVDRWLREEVLFIFFNLMKVLFR